MARPTVAERLWAKVERGPDDCWLWQGAILSTGYGEISMPGKPRTRKVHRVAYEVAVGPIPEGMTIDHICWVKACVNPAHLRLLTSPENNRRQRQAEKLQCVNGHPFDEVNTRVWQHDGQGSKKYVGRTRFCRACARERSRAYRARQSGVVMVSAG